MDLNPKLYVVISHARHFVWFYVEIHRANAPVAVAYSVCTCAGPSATEDVSDIVTGKRRRQHIDYKVAKRTQAAANCLLHSSLRPCHAVNGPSLEFWLSAAAVLHRRPDLITHKCQCLTTDQHASICAQYWWWWWQIHTLKGYIQTFDVAGSQW